MVRPLLLHGEPIFLFFVIYLYSALNSLCKGEGCTVVDGTGLTAHIYFPGITAAFTAATGFFFAAERATYFGSRSTDVYVGYTAIASSMGKELFGFPHIQGHYR